MKPLGERECQAGVEKPSPDDEAVGERECQARVEKPSPNDEGVGGEGVPSAHRKALSQR